jgi:putative glutamine amidotransferase
VQHRPVIGIATQTQEAIPGQSPLAWVMGQRYVQVLIERGAIPWIIPLLKDDLGTLRAIYERIHGVFLTGGVDVDPAAYGEQRFEFCGRSDPPRDAVELTLLRWALADRKPVLGVCRGIQVMNVAVGGTLYQDVGQQRRNAIKHDYFPTTGGFPRDRLSHPLRVTPHSRLATILEETNLQVNSMHHQGIKDLAPGLTPTAFAPDGLIEGVEGNNGQYLIGVQWHPEELVATQPAMRRLFGSFVEAAASRAIAAPLTVTTAATDRS